MAMRGVWQLERLIVSYCNWGGSSRGMRAFIDFELPAFKEKNPQLRVITELRRGQHPHLKGYFRNQRSRYVCVKNLEPQEIKAHAYQLRNSLGHKTVELKRRHYTRHPSVQGTWTPHLKLQELPPWYAPQEHTVPKAGASEI